ncbi:hypothetical protein [Gracilimonas sp.]|uniref:hypothetical protein n=1 Tax=Gracilimonas sp. TaxID=1974203 RepID=UPI002870DEAC|nr:hypothetical protein [Gracilimonas sp.]
MNTQQDLSKAFLYPALITVSILLIPLIAMQFSENVIWTVSDFIFAGLLILSCSLTYTLVTKKTTTVAYRVATGFALLTGLFLIWSNLAVGLIGSEDNEFNLLYFLVIGVGVMGAFIAKFKASGLKYTLFAMAAAQFIITIVALFTGMAEVPDSSVYEILAVNGFFITLFVVAGMLFQYAADEEKSNLSADFD